MAVAGALLVLAAVLCSAAAAGEVATELGARRHQPAVVPAMYVFGDSLVDAGNNDFLPPPAPRAAPPNGVDLPRGVRRRTGRFTNGFNLADIIAQYLGFKKSPPAYLSLTPLSNLDLLRGLVGANYASGGSGILDTTGNGSITLREQIEFFAETKARIIHAGLVSRERLDHALSRSLFLVCVAGNDFGLFDGVPKADAPPLVAGLVAAYLGRIEALHALGARRLAVLDALPVGWLPSQRAATDDGGCDDAGGNALARMFNAGLRQELATAAAAGGSLPGARYAVASLYNAFSDMIANPTLAGLREVKTGCCGGGKFNGEEECGPGASLCDDRDEYLFWDKVHGTEAAYRQAVKAFFYGPTRDADPINLSQLLLEPPSSSTAPAPTYSSI
ncbi:hypothetical protein ACP4OV_023220 [Aristida adscensionis]